MTVKQGSACLPYVALLASAGCGALENAGGGAAANSCRSAEADADCDFAFDQTAEQCEAVPLAWVDYDPSDPLDPDDPDACVLTAPAETVNVAPYEKTLCRLRAYLAEEICRGEIFLGAIRGTCAGGEVLFITLGFPYGGAQHYFDAESGEFIGLRQVNDIGNETCYGERFWPVEFHCEEPSTSETLCSVGF